MENNRWCYNAQSSNTFWPEDGVINLAYNKHTNPEPVYLQYLNTMLNIIAWSW